MGNQYWKSKKRTTMVEVLAAVIILAIVVAAVLTSIGLSQTTIFSNSSQDAAAAQAQNIADALISELHNKTVSAVEADPVNGAVYVVMDQFSRSSADKKFTVSDLIKDDTTKVDGYKIQVAVSFRTAQGRKYVQMTAFAAKDGG